MEHAKWSDLMLQ